MSIRDIIQRSLPTSLPVRRRAHLGQTLLSLQEEMNRLCREVFGDLGPAQESAFPAIDVAETARGFTVSVELPGVEAEAVEVAVLEGFLTVKGEKPDGAGPQDATCIRRESNHGAFHRTIALPETADGDAASASFRNGLLTVEMPKKAAVLSEARMLSVKILS